MHARVKTGQVEPGKMDQLVNIYRDSIVPAAKEQKGFNGIMLLTDPDLGTWISISLWETEADRLANEDSGYAQEQMAKMAHLLVESPPSENYEVSVGPLLA